MFDLLEAEGWDYAIRIKDNRKLYDQIGRLMERRPDRSPNHVVRHYANFHYRANFLRALATTEGIETWSLTSLRERLIKTGTRLVRHARYAIFQMAEVALPRQVFVGILTLINGPRGPPAVTVSAGQEPTSERRRTALAVEGVRPVHAKMAFLAAPDRQWQVSRAWRRPTETPHRRNLA